MSVEKSPVVVQTIKNWLTASNKLAFDIVAPYTLRSETLSIDCIAFLPDFGGPHGMVIGATLSPDFATDPHLIECAQLANLYCSFINAEVYAVYDEERIKESLSDWGYYGDSAKRPPWLLAD